MSSEATDVEPNHSDTGEHPRHFHALWLLIAFVLLNVLTASRYPYVWIDEVMYTDPAANLLLGKGFTSSAWYAQSSDEFWAGNVPGHSLLLYCWMKCFGFSVGAVRSINFLYVALSCWLLWISSIRLGLIRTTAMRVWMLVLILSGYGMIFAYRSGRPDSLAMLLICALVYFYSHKARVWAPAYVLLGAAVPWVGLQLAPMLVTGGLLLLGFLGWSALPRLVAAGSGAAAGFAALAWLYQAHGVWEGFLRSVRQHTLAGVWERLFGGQFQHSNFIPKDFSFAPLFALAVVLAFVQWRQGKLKIRSFLTFGVLYSVCLTIALILGGKFPTYYGWMTYVPLCLCVCAELSVMEMPRVWRRVAGGLMILTIVFGIVPHGAVCLADWRDRDYGRLREFVATSMPVEGSVYCDFGAYYAVKSLNSNVFTYYYLPMISDVEEESVSMLITAGRNFEEVSKRVGGEWIRTGRSYDVERSLLGNDWRFGFLSMENYGYEVYRRKGGEAGE